MGNTIKGTEKVRKERSESTSAENEATTQINRSNSTESKQCQDFQKDGNIAECSSNNAQSIPDEILNGTGMPDKSRDNHNIPNTGNKVLIQDRYIKENTAHLHSAQHQQKYRKTPNVIKPVSHSPGMISKISHQPNPKRSFSDTINDKASIKHDVKRSLSEPCALISPIKEHSSLCDVQSEYSEDNLNALLKDNKELDNDDTESEFEIGSSLRSVSLNSSLCESQTTMDTHTSMEQLGSASQSYNEKRLKLKKGILDYYMSFGFNISEFPLLPHSNVSVKYWPPWMTVTRSFKQGIDETSKLNNLTNDLHTFDMNNYEYDENIYQYGHLFRHEGKDMKNVYIVGDSGTGKTAFCRKLINSWCIQHQMNEHTAGSKIPISREDAHSSAAFIKENRAKYIGSRKSDLFRKVFSSNFSNHMLNDVFSDTYELERYEFLFYIPLFFETNHVHMNDIIETQFRNILKDLKQDADVGKTNVSFLSELFEKESEKCLIVMDGLDQWQENKEKMKNNLSKAFIPGRDPKANYTLIVTSTSAHLERYRIEASQHVMEVTLYGIEENVSKNMIHFQVDRLNKSLGSRKKPTNILEELNSWKLMHFKRFPFVLQSILYLWYHAGTVGNTVCDVYSRILELQIKALSDQLSPNVSNTNNVLKSGGPFKTADKTVKLPRYYINLTRCQKFKELISILGQIALSTRYRSSKVFDSSTLEVYGYNPDEISCLTNVGILTQNYGPGFSHIRHRKTVFFRDEKMQEFLASTYLVQLFQNTAYENIGQINIHTDKILSVLKSHFHIFSSVENILQFSNMITLICGLYPPTTEEITRMIFDVVSTDRRIFDFRKSLQTQSQDDICEEIQDLISGCACESLAVNPNKILLHIGDISYGNFEACYVMYIFHSHVKSLMIDTDKEQSVSTKVSGFVQETRIFDELQKLKIKDEECKLSLEDIDSLHILIQHCFQTLQVLSYIINYKNRIIYSQITQNLHKLLPNMLNLTELELKGIKLSHLEFSALSLTLSRLTRLRRLHLFDIACEMERCDCEEHKMDFLEYKKLEHIEVDGRQLPIVGISKQKLVTCSLGNLPQGAEIKIFSSLQNAKHLRHFMQKVRRRPPFISQTIIQALNTWCGLETLHLNGINFGENELKISAKMNRLSHIKLTETRMSRIVWRNFIDCLRELTQFITIVTRNIYVSPIEDDVTRDPLRRPVDAETRAVMLARESELQEAFNYVTEKEQSFRVLFHLDNMFDFEKK